MLNLIKKSIKWWKTWGSFPCFYWIIAADQYREGHYEKAIELYEKGLKKYQDHPARFCALMDQAYCLFKTKKFHSAIKKLKFVNKHLPESKESYLRLANIYKWIGNDIEATWLLRKAIKNFPNDEELTSMFVFAVLDSSAPDHLIEEAYAQISKFSTSKNHILNTARAALEYEYGEKEEARATLSKIACKLASNIPAKIYFSKILIEEGQYNFARINLTNALKLHPENPVILSLLAKTYQKESEDNDENLNYALQLATSATQNSGWLSPRELHTLAQIYLEFGDKVSALLIASKAQDISRKRSDSYVDSKQLNEFVTSLAGGTLA